MKIIRNTINPELADNAKVIVCPCCLESFLLSECKHTERPSYHGKIIRKKSIETEITCPKCDSQWITDKQVVDKYINPTILDSAPIILLLAIFILGVGLLCYGLMSDSDIVAVIGFIVLLIDGAIIKDNL